MVTRSCRAEGLVNLGEADLLPEQRAEGVPLEWSQSLSQAKGDGVCGVERSAKVDTSNEWPHPFIESH